MSRTDWRVRLEDILEAIRNLEVFTQDMTWLC